MTKHWSRQFLQFGSVGALGTLCHYLVLIVLVQFWHLAPAWGAICGATVGAIVNYLINYRWTFRSSAAHLIAAPKFALLALISIVINGASVAILVAEGVHYLLAQVVATLVVLSLNFILARHYVFR